MVHESESVAWLHAERRITIAEVAECCCLPEAAVRDLVECGALPPADPGASSWEFAADLLPGMRVAARLCADLELEARALPVVLGLLHRIERLETEARALRAQLVRPPSPTNP